MPILALLLTMAAPAERMPVPRDATPAQLRTAVDACKAKAPAGDRCFDLQLALSAALLATGDAKGAQVAAKAAGQDAQTAWADADDLYIAAQSQAERPSATAADKAAYARATSTWKRLWIDQAIAAEAEGAAYAAEPFHRAALNALRRAAAIRESYGEGPTNREAQLRLNTAAAVSLAGAEGLAAGEADIRATLARVRNELGETHALYASAQLNLADMLASRAAFDEAEQLYLRARTALARDRTAAIEADARYARFLIRADRRQDAERVARDILTRLQAMRATPARIATAYLDIADAVSPVDALPLAREAARLRTEGLGEKHIETARSNIVVAHLLERTGQLKEAETLRRPALIVIQASNFIQHPETGHAYLELCENLIQQARAADAAYFCRIALRAFDESVGADSAAAGRAALMLATVAMATGSENPAPLVQRAIPAIRRTLEVTHAERLQAEFILAMMIYHLDGNIPAALRQIRIVTDAGLARARSYRDFGADAQYEMRQIAPAFAAHVRFAWDASQVRAKR